MIFSFASIFLTKQLIYLLLLIIVAFMVEKLKLSSCCGVFGESENKKHFIETTSAENRAGFVASNGEVVRAMATAEKKFLFTIYGARL